MGAFSPWSQSIKHGLFPSWNLPESFCLDKEMCTDPPFLPVQMEQVLLSSLVLHLLVLTAVCEHRHLPFAEGCTVPEARQQDLLGQCSFFGPFLAPRYHTAYDREDPRTHVFVYLQESLSRTGITELPSEQITSYPLKSRPRLSQSSHLTGDRFRWRFPPVSGTPGAPWRAQCPPRCSRLPCATATGSS